MKVPSAKELRQSFVLQSSASCNNEPVSFRSLDSCVSMMQPAKDWMGNNVPPNRSINGIDNSPVVARPQQPDSAISQSHSHFGGAVDARRRLSRPAP